MRSRSLQKKIEEVAKKFELELVVVFGSTSRGETHAQSDLDLAVMAAKPVDAPALVYDLMKALGRDDVDITDLRTAGPTVGYAVARDGEVLLERNPGMFSSFCSLAARKFFDTEKFRRARREMLEVYARGETQ